MIVLYGELSAGSHNRGAPQIRYKDSLMKYHTGYQICRHQWEAQAAHHVAWRWQVRQATSTFEKELRANTEERRGGENSPAPYNGQTFRCNNISLSRLGLIYHWLSCKKCGSPPTRTFDPEAKPRRSLQKRKLLLCPTQITSKLHAVLRVSFAVLLNICNQA